MQLLSKIVRIKKDKEKLVADYENEEECITNNLQRRMSALKLEKSKMEVEVHDLKKQISNMQKEKERVKKNLSLDIYIIVKFTTFVFFSWLGKLKKKRRNFH